MDLLSRGVHVYGLLVWGVLGLVLVWGGNRFVFHNTAAEIGWPVLVGVTVSLTAVIAVVHHLMVISRKNASSWESPDIPYRWNSRK